MTPEDVEARLRSLRTPAPPERLRERCLGPHHASRRPLATLAVAASFLGIGLSVWLVAISGPKPQTVKTIATEIQKHPDPEKRAADPVLQDKVDRLLRENPGKGILVVRVKELRNGTFLPVTSGLWMQIVLQPAKERPDPKKKLDRLEARVDLDGMLIFVATPGPYRVGEVQHSPGEALSMLSFDWWEHKEFSVKAGEVLALADAVFAPFMQWSSPAQGSTVRIKEDPRISWEPYPEIAEVAIQVYRVEKTEGGFTPLSNLGLLKRDASRESGILLAELLKALRITAAPGDRLSFDLSGYDSSGRKLTRSRARLEVLLKE
jgi:hypothetical protein